jgi:hypothetical protein
MLEEPRKRRMAYPLLRNRETMTAPFQFHSRLSRRGAILAQQATFLPINAARSSPPPKTYRLELRHLAGFLPVFDFNRENLALAQALLREDLR